MTLPSFYNPNWKGEDFIPDLEAAKLFGLNNPLRPAIQDRIRRLLLSIDNQSDFIKLLGSLMVTGAIADTNQLAKFIYENPELISGIIASLDQHPPLQISTVGWWAYADGTLVPKYTLITAEQVNKGEVVPLREQAWSVYYINQLGSMMIWPEHCRTGTWGANQVEPLALAIEWLSAAREIDTRYLLKGYIAKTEHFGIFGAEVEVPGEMRTQLDRELIMDINVHYDEVIFTGQAADYCVRKSVDQFLQVSQEFRSRARAKVIVFTDCMSPVFPDKKEENQEVLDGWEKQGVIITTSEEFAKAA